MVFAMSALMLSGLIGTPSPEVNMSVGDDAPAGRDYHPGHKVAGEDMAETLDIPNGKYGVAGVLAWPGRHSAAVGRVLPIRFEDGPVGEGGNYWVEQEVADLFRKARV